MAVAFDAAANGTGTHTHTPVGTPRGVLIIIRMLNAGDNVTTVTYGGVACNETADSPLLASGAEGGSLHAFFLGSSIPTGAQSVVVNVTTGTPRVTSYTVTASADTVVQDTATINETGVTGDRTGTLSLGGNTCFVAEGGWSSADAVTSVTQFAGWTVRNERDDGAEVNFGYSYDTVGSTDVTFGANVTGTEDFTCLAVAITEVASGAYNLDADSASYTYTATDAGLQHGYLIDAATASYAYTANDAGLEHGYQVAADGAAYAWTAQDVSLEYTPIGSYTLDAASAAYSWLANDASLVWSGESAPATSAPAPGGIGHKRRTRAEKDTRRRRILLPDGRLLIPADEAEYRAYVAQIIANIEAGEEAPEPPKRVRKRLRGAVVAPAAVPKLAPVSALPAEFYTALEFHRAGVLNYLTILAAWQAYLAEMDEDEAVTLLLMN